jgi:proto-oncogene serine/threonine-protein kinase mos
MALRVRHADHVSSSGGLLENSREDDDDAFFQMPPRQSCKSFSTASQRQRLQPHHPIHARHPLEAVLEESKPRRHWSLDRMIYLNVLPPVLKIHDISQIRMKRLIGSGGFGSVYLGQFRGRTVAVKKIHRCTKNVKAKVESFRAECSVQHLRHPNIVQVLACSVGDPATKDSWIVMEYGGDKDLQHVIDNPQESLDFRRRIRYSVDIISALRYIHERRVIHLDLKPANIIITSQDFCKLGDFGCCQTIEDDSGLVSPTRRSYLTGTFAYRAPELLRGEPPTSKADIFSFGVTLWSMLSREIPYSGQNQHVVMYGVVAYGVRPRIPPLPLSNLVTMGAVLSGRKSSSGSISSSVSGSLSGSVSSSSSSSISSISSSSSSSSSNSSSSSGCGLGLGNAEEFYRDLFVECWDADPEVRHSASDLAELFEIWSETLF